MNRIHQEEIENQLFFGEIAGLPVWEIEKRVFPAKTDYSDEDRGSWYADDYLEDALDNDEITPEEEGFIRGWRN